MLAHDVSPLIDKPELPLASVSLVFSGTSRILKGQFEADSRLAQSIKTCTHLQGTASLSCLIPVHIDSADILLGRGQPRARRLLLQTFSNPDR